MATVLVVEDEPDLRRLVQILLERADHRVVEAGDGRSGLRAFHEQRPDLVLLDVGLPGLEGWDVLERIRDVSEVPVVLLTARGDEADKVRGLDAGADDYITKPFGSGELRARVDAVLRRRGGSPAAAPDRGEVFSDGRLDLDLVGRQVRVDGEEVVLTPQEYRLLVALVRHVDQVLSAEQLLARAWDDPTAVGPDRVKYVVLRLRRKLAQAAPDFAPIESVRGFGYRYRRA